MMQGKQQQTAIPIRLATATQMTTNITSKARNATQSLQSSRNKDLIKEATYRGDKNHNNQELLETNQ